MKLLIPLDCFTQGQISVQQAQYIRQQQQSMGPPKPPAQGPPNDFLSKAGGVPDHFASSFAQMNLGGDPSALGLSVSYLG